MSRKRYVSTNISTDERVMELEERCGPYAVLLYTWLIPHAADDGTVTGSPRELKLLVIPGLSVPVPDVARFVEAMLDLGLVQRLDDGRLTFPSTSFYTYQAYVRPERRSSEKRDTGEVESDPGRDSTKSAEIQRNSAKNSASSSPSSSPSSSSSFTSPETTPPHPPVATGGAPPAQKRASIPKPTPRVTVVDAACADALCAEFAPLLDETPGEVRDRIDAALGHKKALGYTDLRAYVRNWLRTDVDQHRQRVAQGTRARPSGRPGGAATAPASVTDWIAQRRAVGAVV